MLEELSLPLPQIETTGLQIDLAALVETYSATLFRVAHSVLRNRSEAEDVVQDVFVRVLEHRRTLPAVRDLRVWLIRIAWNLSLDRRRRIRPEQAEAFLLDSVASLHLPADLALDQARQTDTVLRAIDRLPAPERQALLLSALEELGTPEIAEIMGKSESAVRALLFRARTHLRTRLQKNLKQGGKR